MKKNFLFILFFILLFYSCYVFSNNLLQDGIYIKDEYGRVVILRGINYSFEHQCSKSGEFAKKEIEDYKKDFLHIKSCGFNLVRLPVSWNCIEPVKEKINEEYLKEIDKVVKIAKETGIYLIIDMHQWRWSPKFGGCGMPVWTCEKFKDLLEAESEFWKNELLKDKLINIWEIIVRRYKDEKIIFGYDLFNEPMLFNTEIDAKKYLYPFYKKIVERIRKITKTQIIIYEPYTWNPIFDKFINPELPYENICYSMHYYGYGYDYPLLASLYSGGKAGYQKIKEHINKAISYQEKLNQPLLLLEFGITTGAPKATHYVKSIMDIYDELKISWCWWAYCKAKGDNLCLLEEDGSEKKEIMDILSRPYPQFTAGNLINFSFDIDTKKFTIRYKPELKTKQPTIIYIPVNRHYKNGFKILSDNKISYEFDELNSLLKIIPLEENIIEINIFPD